MFFSTMRLPRARAGDDVAALITNPRACEATDVVTCDFTATAAAEREKQMLRN